MPLYYREAKAALIVYDITSRASFDQAAVWIKKLNDEVRSGQPTVMTLVGNKTDLEESRCVTSQEGQAMADTANVLFIETSAKINFNITELFVKIAQHLRDGPLVFNEFRGVIKPGTNDPKTAAKGCAC